MTTRPSLALLAIMFMMLSACSPTPAPGAPAPTSTPSATSTLAAATGTPAPSPTASAFPAPRNLKLSGRLPDISTPVPPGEGELGRLTIAWESAAGPSGFRIYTKDCDGTVKAALDVPAADRQYGPIHACRPTGNLGVAALYAGGESAISWVR